MFAFMKWEHSIVESSCSSNEKLPFLDLRKMIGRITHFTLLTKEKRVTIQSYNQLQEGRWVLERVNSNLLPKSAPMRAYMHPSGMSAALE
jgi:hypothetical protein